MSYSSIRDLDLKVARACRRDSRAAPAAPRRSTSQLLFGRARSSPRAMTIRACAPTAERLELREWPDVAASVDPMQALG